MHTWIKNHCTIGVPLHPNPDIVTNTSKPNFIVLNSLVIIPITLDNVTITPHISVIITYNMDEKCQMDNKFYGRLRHLRPPFGKSK